MKFAMSKENQIFRNFKDGKSSIPGFLDDYAFVCSAFIELYQATFDQQWLKIAQKICEIVIENFFDKDTGMFFYTSLA